MNDIEKRARELLAAQFNGEGREQFERGQAVVVTTAGALNAIIAALTPPEGYVMVPVETLEEITHYAEGFVSTHEFVLMKKERKMLHVRKAQEILIARPEVP